MESLHPTEVISASNRTNEEEAYMSTAAESRPLTHPVPVVRDSSYPLLLLATPPSPSANEDPSKKPKRRPAAEPTGEWPAGVRSYRHRWYRHHLTCTLTQMRGHFEEHYSHKRVEPVPWNRIVKFGKGVHITEAFALLLVAQKTTIPVPRVYSTFTRRGITYIVMERIKGTVLSEVWKDILEDNQQIIVSELRGYFEQLRKIPHPRLGTICSAAGDDHPIFPYLTPLNDNGAGPFETERDFNMFLRSGKPKLSAAAAQWRQPEFMRKYLERVIEMQDKTSHQICFTHGDLAPRNIMVKRSRDVYHVVALIDFEMSGFLPEYWEYISAKGSSFWEYWWDDVVDRFLLPYPDQLKTKKDRLVYFGRFGG